MRKGLILMSLVAVSLFLYQAFITPAVAIEKKAIEKKKDYYVSEIKISGDVVRPATLTLEDLRKMRQITLRSVPKMARYKGYLGMYDYIGVPLKDVIETAGLVGGLYKRARFFVVVRAPDGFRATFSWGEIFNRHDGEQIIIALKSRQVRNARNELVDEQGFQDLKPRWGGAFRMVVPNDSQYSDERSVKWVWEIKICDSDIVFSKKTH